ncbi:MAG: 2-oxoacid:acceptor oxidoreductase family protein [Erysipelotrichaceae bacterium]|nr:2-oxoacid:acceptor oxidoreductase family protein [Erysipelotrichaceae bacterium]
MERRIVIAGFGGQGVLTLGQIVSLMAMEVDLNVTWIPSYGAEMRGGTANCAVIISDKKIGSPIVNDKIDILIAMNAPSLQKFVGLVQTGGSVIVNKSIINSIFDNADKFIYEVNATDIALRIGDIRCANIVVLGALCKIVNELDLSLAKRIVAKKFVKKCELLKLNELALFEGFQSI